MNIRSYSKKSVFSLPRRNSDQINDVLRLRGGEIPHQRALEIALAVAVWYYLYRSNFRSTAFQTPRVPNNQITPNSHTGGPGGAGVGSSSSNRIMALGSNRRNEAPDNKILQNAYSQIPNLSVEGTNEQITAWSAAKHSHHGPAFGIDPTQYGLTKTDLKSIQQKGLIKHI